MKLAPFLTATLALNFVAIAQDQVLFNGLDLSEWEGNSALWSVRDGSIHGETALDPVRAPKSTLHDNTYLVWKGTPPPDFEFHVKIRFTSAWGNSGIQFRSKVVREAVDGPIVAGYQADIETGSTYSGILYEERGHGILANRGEKVLVSQDPENPRKTLLSITGSLAPSEASQKTSVPGEWSEYVILVKGNHIQQFLNGEHTVDVTDERPTAPKEGVIALQIHQQQPMTVEFKDIILKPLK